MFIVVLSVIITAIAIIRTNKLCVVVSAYDGESEYSNDPPGKQGERQTQAVACFSAWYGLSVSVGCCLGSEQCNNMNPCNGGNFSCDNQHWIEPETGGNGNG